MISHVSTYVPEFVVSNRLNASCSSSISSWLNPGCSTFSSAAAPPLPPPPPPLEASADDDEDEDDTELPSASARGFAEDAAAAAAADEDRPCWQVCTGEMAVGESWNSRLSFGRGSGKRNKINVSKPEHVPLLESTFKLRFGRARKRKKRGRTGMFEFCFVASTSAVKRCVVPCAWGLTGSGNGFRPCGKPK